MADHLPAVPDGDAADPDLPLAEDGFRRTALPALLAFRAEVPDSFGPPPARTPVPSRPRLAVAMAAVAVMIVSVTAVALLRDQVRSGKPPSGPGATGIADWTPRLPDPPPAFVGVDWRNLTLRFPSTQIDSYCPTGDVRLVDNTYSHGDRALHLAIPGGPSGGLRYGDLTGDGQPEAVVAFACNDGLLRPGWSGVLTGGPVHTGLLVVAKQGTTLAVIASLNAVAVAFTVTGGRLKAAVGQPTGPSDNISPHVHTTYELRDGQLVRSKPLPEARSLLGTPLRLPTIVSATARPDEAPACPGGEARFSKQTMRSATATIGTTTYTINAVGPIMSLYLSASESIDLDGDDVLEMVMDIGCRPADGEQRSSLYVLRQTTTGFEVVDVPYADNRAPGSPTLVGYSWGGDGAIWIRDRTGDAQTPARDTLLHWDGTRFQPRVGEFRP